jgi:hypothetical protein
VRRRWDAASRVLKAVMRRMPAKVQFEQWPQGLEKEKARLG